jgi:hypothetical protein
LEVVGVVEGAGPVRRMDELVGWKMALVKGRVGMWMVWRWGLVRPSICGALVVD